MKSKLIFKRAAPLLAILICFGMLFTALNFAVNPTTHAAPPSPEDSKFEIEQVDVDSVQVISRDESESGLYIVRLEDAPVSSYRGGVPGLRATNPAASGRGKLDVQSTESVAYRSYLVNRQAQVQSSMERAVGHSLEVRFQYQLALNGMAVELTAEEAARVAKLDGVTSVTPDWVEYAQTDTGPGWMGAPEIWGGGFNNLPFKAVLSGANEVSPTVATNASGLGTFSYNLDTRVLSYTIEVSNIMTITGAHIHSGTMGNNGPVVHGLYNGTGPFDPSNPISGAVTLTQDQQGRLMNKGLYINVHTESHGAGEIRGQIESTGSMGEGIVVGIVDTGTNIDHPSFAEVGGDGYVHTNHRGKFYGWCDPAHANYDPNLACNNKLIGLWSGDADGPEDFSDHGSHVGGTVAGNVLFDAVVNAPTTAITMSRISGVAPHANVIGYNIEGTAGTGSASGATIIAATDQAIADQVDVINYSFGGGNNDPWLASEHWFNVRNAGIFVATSAGNSGSAAATLGSPGNSPWMFTVASSSHNRVFSNVLMTLTGGDTAPPADINGEGLTSGYGPATIVYAGTISATNPGCDLAYQPGTFSGEIVVCDYNQGPGAIAGQYGGRVNKSVNLANAGAGGFILINRVDWAVSLMVDSYAVPGMGVPYDQGEALKTWLASGTGHQATIRGVMNEPARGDIMAGFSSRGPISPPNIAADFIKPDVTAPGRRIVAAIGTTNPADPPEFDVFQGTSMSSPHAAGAAALMRALHPTWTVAELQSALMTTALNNGVLKEDATTQADPFDMGAGRVDLTVAAKAGLVLDETPSNLWDANPANPNGDPKALNLASMANSQCVGSCSWTRTVKNSLDTPQEWNASLTLPPTMTGSVTPANFTLAPGATQELTINVDVINMPLDVWAFGELQLNPVASTATAYEGTNIGGPEWDYPIVSGGNCVISTNGPVRYHQQSLTVDTTGTYSINSDQNYDGYLHLYQGSFDSTDQCANLIALNDDGSTGLGSSEINGITLTVGTQYLLITSGWGNGNEGNFTNAIDGPGNVTFASGGFTPDTPPAAHMPIAVQPSRGALPSSIEIDTRRNAGSQLVPGLQTIAASQLTVGAKGLAKADVNTFELLEDPTKTIPSGFYDDLSQVYWKTISVPANSYSLIADIISSESPDIDMAVGFDTNGDGQPELSEQVCQSAGGSWTEFCEIPSPAAGTWWVVVLNWAESANAPDEIKLATVAVPNANSNNIWATGPMTVSAGGFFDLRAYWDIPTMVAGDHWYGALTLGTDPANAGNIGTIPVYLTRHADDVSKQASQTDVTLGEIIDYSITIQPNVTPEDLLYMLSDTIPANTTYVAGSASATQGSVAVVNNTLTWTGTLPALTTREYVATTSLNDPSCAMPLANSGNYVDLEQFGFLTDANIFGNDVAFQETSYGGGPYQFYNNPTTSNVYYTDDGFVSLDIPSVFGPRINAPIPTAGLPDALLAILWNDMEIVYENGTGESNRGVTTGINLTSGGVPSAKLLEFDDIQLVGDPSSQIDLGMMLRETISDDAGIYEVVFAYDNLTGAFTNLTTGTIGVENHDGTQGTQYAYNDANLMTLQDGMAICFNSQFVQPDPVEITFQVTANAFGTVVNTVDHNTDNPGSKEASASATTNVVPSYGVDVLNTPDNSGFSGTTVSYSVDVKNLGNVPDTFNLSVSGNWAASISPSSIMLAAGETKTVKVNVRIPANAAHDSTESTTVTAVSQTSSSATDSMSWNTTAMLPATPTVIPPTATPTVVATQTPTPTPTTIPGGDDGDNDGIDNAIENGVPNPDGSGTGDGNGDGIPDSEQHHVNSLPNQGSGNSQGYVTFEVPVGVDMVDLMTRPAPAQMPEGVTHMPQGMFEFKLSGFNSQSVMVNITLHAGDTPDTYYKYDENSQTWYEFLSDETTGAVISDDGMGNTIITLHLVDGGRGDADGLVNGMIDDPGAPAITSMPPTSVELTRLEGSGTSNWPLAMIGSLTLAAGVGLWLRRRK